MLLLKCGKSLRSCVQKNKKILEAASATPQLPSKYT